MNRDWRKNPMKYKWKITRYCQTCIGAGVLGIEYEPVSDTPCTDCGGDCQVVTYEDTAAYGSLKELHLDYPEDEIVSLKILNEFNIEH